MASGDTMMDDPDWSPVKEKVFDNLGSAIVVLKQYIDFSQPRSCRFDTTYTGRL